MSKILKLRYPINLVLDTPVDVSPTLMTELMDFCLTNEIPEEVVDECQTIINGLIEDRLSAREKEIIKLRYEQYLTLEQISQLSTPKVCRDRIRQIIAKVLRKLKLKSTAIYPIAIIASDKADDVMKYTIFKEHGYLRYYDQLSVFNCYDKAKWHHEFIQGDRKPDISWFESNEKYQFIAANSLEEYINSLNNRITNLTCENAALKEKLGIKVEPSHSALVDLIPIGDLDLSVRSYNVLKRAGYNKVADLRKATRSDIMKLRNAGTRTCSEIVKVLDRLGITIIDDTDDGV